MNQETQLRDLVATILMAQPAAIGSGTSLASLHNSLGEAKLRLGLKRLGIKMPERFRPATFGELLDAVSGKPAQPANDTFPGIPIGSFSDLRVGLDVQDVGALPIAHDYWEHEFYQGIFGKSEIAYAATQSDPPAHFAGFWCAKEALRKCDPSFAKIDPTTTVVSHEDDGRPFFLWTTSGEEKRLPHALSISHAANIAMAVVIALPRAGEKR